MFNVDGYEWNLPCKIERTAELTPSEISGMLLDKRYFNDVIGTFMKYTVSIEVPARMMDAYTDIYEILTAPVDGHTFILPYNQSEITITGRVQVVSDDYVKKPGGRNYWKGTKFDVIANHPSKTMSLTDVITTGMTPLPEAPGAQVGDLYEYTSYGWIQRFYDDADEVYY